MVRIVVPYAPGGITDVLARLAADGLSRSLGQQFIVENRPGGGTSIGTRAVVTAPPDGYTLLMGTTVLSINPHLMPDLDYDAAKDLVPIVSIGESISIIAVANSVSANSLSELVSLDQAKPGQLSFGSAGSGSISHIAGESLNQMAKTSFVHVPYRGSGPLMNDAIGGHVPIVFDSLITALPAIQSGKIRPLAVLQQKRTDIIPNVPTTAEAGFPGLISTSYYGLLAPKGTSSGIVEKLNTEINRILADPDVQQRVRQQGAILTGGSSSDFRKLIDETTARYGEIIKTAKIQAN